MQLIKSELPAGCDVDKTLIMPDADPSHPDAIYLTKPGGHGGWYMPHKAHIELLKDWKARGYFIVVWSANGWEWVDTVTHALGIQDKVDIGMTKLGKHIDDETDPIHIIGPRIYFPFSMEKK